MTEPKWGQGTGSVLNTKTGFLKVFDFVQELGQGLGEALNCVMSRVKPEMTG